MNKEAKQFLNSYMGFVDAVTSEESKSTTVMVQRIQDLTNQGMDVARLNTAQVGLCAESGEFAEIVKKIMYQGKPYNADNVFHMKRELGDVMWYMMQACLALNLDLDDIIEENIRKLEARYPGGKFDIGASENRSSGDI